MNIFVDMKWGKVDINGALWRERQFVVNVVDK